MSRIELDDSDRRTVERAREALAASEAMWTSGERDVARMLGRLEVVVSELLHIVDGGQEADR
ncbi:hypothetical protein KBZ10_11555 [Streptomyces sp. F63]|uniref:hypothetical protein n=1 Tax=Streptomyces sp. F63 TaxID=2824887 RepID=UPI001B392EF9|nr:hypothetical protein [Streptomyces sp. F63]MBQ0985145.1 hypothetical protein [Streptomyces sp. F63]